tara:strand:- start:55 stop:426 length:372 start_codon:yes stop_codon:yes gene_type:complete
VEVSKDIFEDFVRTAIASLPERFIANMRNVSVIVADRPSPDQIAESGIGPDEALYGLYDGVPLTERGGYVPPLPDVITIFQNPLQDGCRSLEQLQYEVRKTVMHELAHYFGFSDIESQDLGLG